MGSFTITARTDAYNPDNVQLSFIGASTPNGSPDLTLQTVEEELTSAGVDGRRFRTIHKQYSPFQVIAISDHADFDGADAQKWEVEKLVGRVVDVAWTVAGGSYTIRALHVSAASTRVVMGRTAGYGVTTGAGAVAESTITLLKMFDDGSGSITS